MLRRVFLFGLLAALITMGVRLAWDMTMLRQYRPEWLVGILAVLFGSVGYVLARRRRATPDASAAVSGPAGTTSAQTLKQHYGLTDAELQVLEALARGLSNAQIAEIRHVSVNTVKTQISGLYEKLGVSSRVQAVSLFLGKPHPNG